ncbi:hypothetical protein QFC20_006467 [Naganishia adeliensis]|uniref:Uncharacterized protein n=1 Tax=Naganishia adeliensis TaxID=92952 RepID=A0ACC2VAS3_9TREE|nr:hypothetical protein QFC20_006467 [Naganishia adeliensis]
MSISGQALAHLLSTPRPSVRLPSTPPVYTPDQTRLIDALIAYFTPTSTSPDKSPCLPLSPDEQLFLSRETLIRFLTGTKNDLSHTKARLDKCLTWRRSLGVDQISETAAEVAPEGVCGKEFVLGYSTKGQPVLHFLPNKSDTQESQRQLKHVVYMLERTADLMPPGVNNLVLIIDFAGKKSAPTSPGMAKQFISVLQDFYPERLGTAVLLSIPWIVRKFLDFAFTFVDPVTKAKVRWHVDVVKEGIVPADEAVKDYGGTVDFAYKQEDYWNLLRDTVLAKRAVWRENWKQLGGGVGQPEWEFKKEYQQPTAPTSQLVSSPSNSQQQLSPATATSSEITYAATPNASTPARSESVSSDATYHENHGLDLHSFDKAMGGLVIVEDA